MIDTLDFKKIKTGLELEVEFNKVIEKAFNHEIDNESAEEILEEMYNYGVKSKKFSQKEHKYYMMRKNTQGNRLRTHLEMAKNIKIGQDNEHITFLYFIKWLKNEYSNHKIEWKYNGSDADGYIMIVNESLNKVKEPDYAISIDGENKLIEVKNFRNPLSPPKFKKANIIKYTKYKKEKCYMVFTYKGKYHLVSPCGIKNILRLAEGDGWQQKTIIMSKENISNFVKNNLIKEFKNVD